jgi:hypothetical protein
MTNLTDFLREEAVRLREESPKREAILREWTAALDRLYVQIRTWLGEVDTEGVLKIDAIPEDITEAGLGTYRVPGLRVGLDDRSVRFVPRARRALAPLRVEGAAKGAVKGRVDLMDGPVANRVLYLVVDGQGERWVMTGPLGGEPVPFDQKELEAALLSALQ